MRSLVLFSSLLLLPGCPPDGAFRAGSAEHSMGIIDDRSAPYEEYRVGEEGTQLVLALVRGEEPKPSEVLSQLEGRRVFVSVFGVRKTPLVATGMGDDLEGSLREAAMAIRGQIPMSHLRPSGTWRVEISIASALVARRFKGDVWRPARTDVGAYGIWMEALNEEGIVETRTWITGAELVREGMWKGSPTGGVPLERLLKYLAKRSGSVEPGKRTQYGELTTIDWIDSVNGGAQRVYRGYVEAQRPLTVELMERRALHGADYLARAIGEQGRYDYRYFPATDRSASSYNMLRHAGSTWSLLQAYQRFGDDDYRAAAVRAIGYFLACTELHDDAGPWGDNYRFCKFDNYVKLGGNGLGLLMLADYAEATGDRTHLSAMRELGRFIRFMQEENGHFISYYDWDGPDADVAIVPDEDSIYYPGEACFGLLKLYALDPDPLWLETAKKGIDYMIFDRDAGKGEKRIPHDHWLMYALSMLYQHIPDEAYLEHGRLIARAIMNKQVTADDKLAQTHPDYLGGFYRPATYTPAGTRVEALIAGIDLERFSDGEVEPLLTSATEAAAFGTGTMYSPDGAYFMPNPSKGLGGIALGHAETFIQNDHVQHNISGLIGLERHLRALQGERLPGGPGWTGPARIPTPEDLVRWSRWRSEWGAGPTNDWRPNDVQTIGDEDVPASSEKETREISN